MTDSTKTLELIRETLRVLDDDQLADARGGTDGSAQQLPVSVSQISDPDIPE